MKKALVFIAGLALAFTLTSNAQIALNPVGLSTNAAGQPTLSGPFIDVLSKVATLTNWGVSTFGIYEPASGSHKSTFGAGALALYNITPVVATGIGIDYLENQVTMPSAQVQFQLPLLIGGTNGVLVRPFAFTGVATPIGGKGQDNGAVVGLFGAGLGVRIVGGLNAYYAIEQRTAQPAPWHLLGIAYSASF